MGTTTTRVPNRKGEMGSNGITHLQHEYLPGSPVDVELAVGRVVRVDPLTREEVDDVLGPVLVSVRRRNLSNGR